MIRPAIFDDSPGLVAGFTTRDFAEPEPHAVVAARVRLAERFHFGAVASAGQVHGADVAVVTDAGHVPERDGLVTDRAGLLLTVLAADCALVLLADPEAGVLGACHSGWRGTVANVTGRTIAAMENLGAKTARLRAYVSPCIGADAFEVGEEVAAAFGSAHVARRSEWPRPHVDLKAAVADQLHAAGISEGHMEIDTLCTASTPERLYSYRAEGGTAGRMIGFIGRYPPGQPEGA